MKILVSQRSFKNSRFMDYTGSNQIGADSVKKFGFPCDSALFQTAPSQTKMAAIANKFLDLHLLYCR